MVTSAQCLRKYGLPYNDPKTPQDENMKFELAWMVIWSVPDSICEAIPTIPARIYCNKDLLTPLEKALQTVVNRHLGGQIKTWDGCFNIRSKKGASSLSLHSWGLAIDINAAWNGFGKKPTMSAALVACFKENGFEWGGDWATRKDGMHFQLSVI